VPRWWDANQIADMTSDQVLGMIVPGKKGGRVRLRDEEVTPERIAELEEAWARENSPEAKRAKAIAGLDQELRRYGL
jgi:hypothetical protein